MKTCIIVPIKTTNKRLPGKTFKQLGGKPLYSYLFDTLKSQSKANIYIDSSDEKVLCIGKDHGFNTLKRPEEFNSDETSGDELLNRVIEKLQYEIIGQFHITSPFIKRKTVEAAIENIENDRLIDSLLGVAPRYNRFWYENKPINHDVGNLVRTQDLTPLHEEADFYLVKRESFQKYKKRVCGIIRTFEVSNYEATDIDTFEDFVYAEALLNSSQ